MLGSLLGLDAGPDLGLRKWASSLGQIGSNFMLEKAWALSPIKAITKIKMKSKNENENENK